MYIPSVQRGQAWLIMQILPSMEIRLAKYRYLAELTEECFHSKQQPFSLHDGWLNDLDEIVSSQLRFSLGTYYCFYLIQTVMIFFFSKPYQIMLIVSMWFF